MQKRSIAALVLTTSLVFAGHAFAQAKLDKVVRVGSLGDQSGLYADIGGPGSPSQPKWRSRIPGCWPRAGRST